VGGKKIAHGHPLSLRNARPRRRHRSFRSKNNFQSMSLLHFSQIDGRDGFEAFALFGGLLPPAINFGSKAHAVLRARAQAGNTQLGASDRILQVNILNPRKQISEYRSRQLHVRRFFLPGKQLPTVSRPTLHPRNGISMAVARRGPRHIAGAKLTLGILS